MLLKFVVVVVKSHQSLFVSMCSMNSMSVKMPLPTLSSGWFFF